MEVDNKIFHCTETGEDKKIFHSDVTRVNILQSSDLRELLCVTPATPIPVKVSENETCTFEPKIEKYYVPKRRSRLKVRTVRDIRNLFEKDNYRYIVEDMERQQNALLKKIRTGSAFDKTTRIMAKKLLKADHPISRTAWQMLSNINPEGNANPTQFVLWNGRRIRVVGSKGGKTKFISNYDLEKKDIEVKERKGIIAKNTRKHGLLHNSLSIKLKPGPLGKKKYLDNSYQKYHVGPIEVVNLPKPALDIHPAFGKVVEPVMANFLNKLRPDDGTISEKWAEFTVSVLGTVKNNSLNQYNPECCVTFDLSYKYAQNRILMRRDIFNLPPTNAHETAREYPFINKCNKSEVKNIMDNILDSVEISLMQDSMYADEKESQQNSPEAGLPNEDHSIFVKEKGRKNLRELDRLAVTGIRLPGTPKMDPSKPCGKVYCNLGCVCDSLNCTYKFKQHCGNSECMFGCKCKMSKFKDIELLESGYNAELIPGLMNLADANISNLAKEEQKFHQTILMKPKKRNSKYSKEYQQFYSNVRLKNQSETKKILTIVDKKLNISNIEPWCMVHNLYRCFCKGRFTESATLNSADAIPTFNITNTVDLTNAESTEPSLENIEMKNHINKDLQSRIHRSAKSSERKSITLFELCLKDINIDETATTCARVNKYAGRKYNQEYYITTNYKIKQMEENDTTLHNKMLKLIEISAANSTPHDLCSKNKLKNSSIFEKSKIQSDDYLRKHREHKGVGAVKSNDSGSLPLQTKVIFDSLQTEVIDIVNTDPESELYDPFEICGDLYKPIDTKKQRQDYLTPWIAKSYKQYIEQTNSGKNTLERPRRSKIILHLWDSLIERYTSHRNIFLITRKRPFRIFIATDIHKPFFAHCSNINSIPHVDVSKYPHYVRKLLNRSPSKDYFCILGGWDDCWEIIGSVKRNDSNYLSCSSDSNLSKDENSFNDSDSVPISIPSSPQNRHLNEQHEPSTENVWPQDKNKKSIESETSEQHEPSTENDWSQDNNKKSIESETSEQHEPGTENDRLQDNNRKSIESETSERSKWFLMKLQDDFTDVYCHIKGFYVERQKLIRAIHLARITHKTIVINKQTSSITENIPFGIYALPITSEYFAVVGPYEMDEPLGLEIVKSKSVSIQKSTKGYWLTTNKVDNLKVLDDPIAFFPRTTSSILSNVIDNSEAPGGLKPSTMSVDESNEHADIIGDVNKKKQEYSNDATTQKKNPKLVKPIKIRRTNGFYHLTPYNNTILNNALPSTSSLRVKSLAKNDFTNEQKFVCPINNQSDIEMKESGAVPLYVKNETEASHIKITSVYSENVEEIAKQNGKPGMLILKPEQINKKINYDTKSSKDDSELDMDIKNFLSSPIANTSVDNGDYLVISDDDEDEGIDDVTASNLSDTWSDVWIQCSTIKNLGWIHGKRNSDNLLRIDFPGFEPNKLYTESEAMDKINKTMSVRIAVPEQVRLKWQVIKQKPLSSRKAIDKQNLVTSSPSTCSSMKYRLRIRQKTTPTANTPQAKLNLFEDLPTPGATANTSQAKLNLFEDLPTPGATALNQNSELFEGLEETSRLLEDESDLLMNEAEKRQSEITETLMFPEKTRLEMSETLQEMMTLNDDLDVDK